MIDWKKPIETVDGREARFIGPEPLASLPEARIVHVRERNLSPLSCGDVFLVNDEGYRCDDRAIYSKRQEPFIRNVRVKREGWVIKLKGKDCLWDFHIYSSEETAVMHVPAGTVHEVVRIRWEEEP